MTCTFRLPAMDTTRKGTASTQTASTHVPYAGCSLSHMSSYCRRPEKLCLLAVAVAGAVAVAVAGAGAGAGAGAVAGCNKIIQLWHGRHH